jgi:hypothetical protein
MIGNTIEFVFIDFNDNERHLKPLSDKQDVRIGLVVDAFTDVSGSMSGKSESFLGFGEGRMSGSTKSKRKYLIESFENWDQGKKHPILIEIYQWQVKKITSYAGNPQQEINEEKFREGKN